MKKILLCLSMLWGGVVSAQPMLVSEIPNSSSYFKKGENLVFFTTSDSLMVTDGTTSGTVLVKSGFVNPYPINAIGDLLYFVSGDGELWRSDGTAYGTYWLYTFSSREIGNQFTLGSALYFSAVTAATGRELYRSDGTVGGTILLKDIYSGSGSGIGDVDYLPVGNTLYFQATDATHGKELWKTDGTPAGTVLVKDAWPGTGDGYVKGLWENNGTIYFGGNDGTRGTELWKSDGTAGGTLMIKDVNPGAPGGFTGDTLLFANNEAFFVANDGVHKLNVWKTDGTSLGTNLIKELEVEDDYYKVDLLYTYGGLVYYSVYWESWADAWLWKTDGSEAGTSSYKTFYNTYFDVEQSLFHDGKLYQIISDGGDWVSLLVTDGTEEATFLKEVGGYGDVEVWDMTILNDHVIFGFTGQSSAFWGYYKSDGTEAGSKFFTSGAISKPRSQVILDNKLFFSMDVGYYDLGGVNHPDHYWQLQYSDLESTTLLQTQSGVSLAGSDNLFEINGNLLFTTYNDHYLAPQPQQKRLWLYNPDSTQCASSGAILREFWDNETGTTIASVPFETTIPDTAFLLTSFQAPSNTGTFYGARYRGYVCAPSTGNYRFWIASNDAGELWLSTDESPENKIKIASVASFTDPLQWNKFPTQQSAPIALQAGKKYYIEALHKQNAGTDHMAVGWQLPDNTYERPIPGGRLSPYANQAPIIQLTVPEGPFTDTDNVLIEAEASDPDGVIVKVEFYANDRKVGEDLSAPYTYTLPKLQGNQRIRARAIDNSGEVVISNERFEYFAMAPDRFTLVDATTDQDIYDMENSAVVRMFPTRKINIRYNPVGNPASVVFKVDGVQRRIENTAPFALGGDNNGDYHPVTNLLEGFRELIAEEYSGNNGSGQLLHSRILYFIIDSVITASGQYISHFTLYDATTNQPLRFITSSMAINLDQLPTDQLAIVANTYPPTVGSVRLSYGESLNRMENQAPYSLFGDNSGDLNAGSLLPGYNPLTATPYSSNNGGGQEGYALTVYLSVTGSYSASRLALMDEAVNGAANATLHCYPNPASTQVDIEIRTDAASRSLVEIYDVAGTLKAQVYDGFLSERELVTLTWSLAGQSPGIYLVKVTMDESVYTEKLIVR